MVNCIKSPKIIVFMYAHKHRSKYSYWRIYIQIKILHFTEKSPTHILIGAAEKNITKSTYLQAA